MCIRISGDEHLWPNGIIPYEIDAMDFPAGSSGYNAVLAAIAEWNTKTNITLIPRNGENDYVYFKLGDNENVSDSQVGRKCGRQDINGQSLNLNSGPLIHEIGHAVGLFHEQTREDRDKYVNVNSSNILNGQESQFSQHIHDGDDIGAYDYSSIMHYGRKAFPKNPLVDTIVPISWFGTETQAAGMASADISGSGIANDLVIFHIDNPAGENNGYYRIIWGAKQDGTDNGMSELFQIPGWFGTNNQGGGIAVTDITGNGRPDLLVFFIDNPKGENHGYYRIGWDMKNNGQVSSWSEIFQVDGWFGSETSGAGVALVKLNDNPYWDMVVFHIDNPGGNNQGYYRIGYEIGNTGIVRRWMPPFPIPGWFGTETQGAGIAIGNIGGVNNIIILFHIDNPGGENKGYLRLGQLKANGSVVNWVGPNLIPGWFGTESQDGDICLINFAGNTSLALLHIDNPDGENRGYLRYGSGLNVNLSPLSWSNIFPVHNFGTDAINTIGNLVSLSPLDIRGVNTIYPFKTAYGNPMRAQGWFGSENQGADVALADINGNGRPDMVIFFIDNPNGTNTGYYKIGWDLDNRGMASSFTGAIAIPGWWGNESAGAGIAIADISGNGKLDIVVMHIDNPGGANQGYYRIGWDLDVSGNVTGGWTSHIPIPGWFGDESSDAGIAIADITGSGRPDLIVLHIDNPGGANQGYFRIGKDMTATGTIASWTSTQPIPGWFGNETQGAGVAIKDVTGNGKPDIIVFHIDNPSGANHGYYRIGWDIDSFGNISGGWTRPIQIAGWFGDEDQGAGIVVANFDGDGSNDFLIFNIDNPSGENHGYYRVIFNPLLS
ncbi:hypothetical protein A4H97_33655 [Niastella yeongjuensis]|uniref:Peptidase M12A domain-containing protein n=1 Tax=Niastella yeongjuensis TaxID=354355 RepID=A0A1V9EDN0_9BACT|nr:M12 family metallopeptidase [Niastella yeongjuensis]OQP44151.1 hypothetical protein A4H97_33655 [Niastella yeongjuensis]SEO49994.1 Astacin (Peptidase family M12A) [Niastella yeongjuensis]